MSKEEKKQRQQHKEKIKQEKAFAKAESKQEKAAAKAESKQEKQAVKEQSRHEKAASKELEKQEKQQRKAEDNKRRHTDIKWDRLDNTAHLFRSLRRINEQCVPDCSYLKGRGAAGVSAAGTGYRTSKISGL